MRRYGRYIDKTVCSNSDHNVAHKKNMYFVIL